MKLLKKVLCLTLIASLTISNVAFAQTNEAVIYDANNTVIKDNTTEYIELYQDNNIYTYYYQNFNNGIVVVITSSENGTNCYYNNNGIVGECISEQYASTYLSEQSNFMNLSNEVVQTLVGNSTNDMILNIIEDANQGISMYGLTTTKDFWNYKYGPSYSDLHVDSKVLEGYQCDVYQSKQVSINEINKYVAYAGEALGLLLSFLTMPKSVATAISIVTFVKDGIELIKNNTTVLKYSAVESFVRDATVKGLTMYQAGKTDNYYIYENNTNHAVEFRFNSSDQYYSNTSKLMELGLAQYKTWN